MHEFLEIRISKKHRISYTVKVSIRDTQRTVHADRSVFFAVPLIPKVRKVWIEEKGCDLHPSTIFGFFTTVIPHFLPCLVCKKRKTGWGKTEDYAWMQIAPLFVNSYPLHFRDGHARCAVRRVLVSSLGRARLVCGSLLASKGSSHASHVSQSEWSGGTAGGRRWAGFRRASRVPSDRGHASRR